MKEIDSDNDFRTCPAGDCTGLIPALPEDDAELEAYEELYPFLTKAQVPDED